MAKQFTYTNRRGDTYYVHEFRTKAGARRYAMRQKPDAALAELPKGMEINANVNGLVYIRKPRARIILPLEEKLVRQALATHGRENYRVEVKGRDILIHKPNQDPDEIANLLDTVSGFGIFGETVEKLMKEKVGEEVWRDYRQQKKEEVRQKAQQIIMYSPVLRLRLQKGQPRLFTVDRMSYSGCGGWLWLRDDMPLAAACDHFLPLLGTDELFEEF